MAILSARATSTTGGPAAAIVSRSARLRCAYAVIVSSSLSGATISPTPSPKAARPSPTSRGVSSTTSCKQRYQLQSLVVAVLTQHVGYRSCVLEPFAGGRQNAVVGLGEERQRALLT